MRALAVVALSALLSGCGREFDLEAFPLDANAPEGSALQDSGGADSRSDGALRGDADASTADAAVDGGTDTAALDSGQDAPPLCTPFDAGFQCGSTMTYEAPAYFCRFVNVTGGVYSVEPSAPACQCLESYTCACITQDGGGAYCATPLVMTCAEDAGIVYVSCN